MLAIGKFNKLVVKKETDFGLYLESDRGEILLPKKYVPTGTQIGDTLDVFIYRDSEDRLIATTLVPTAQVGDFAVLPVVAVNDCGAFLDWGLEKHLLAPYREQGGKMLKGKTYVVKVLLDEKTERIIASARIKRFLSNMTLDVTEGEDVDLLVYHLSPLGYQVIINNQYGGLLYGTDVFRQIKIGDKLRGYIKKIREDNKIDVALRNYAYEEVPEGKEKIIQALEKNDGSLPLNDKSDPEEIKESLQMSKKTFKKAIGSLYKEKKIILLPDRIELVKN